MQEQQQIYVQFLFLRTSLTMQSKKLRMKINEEEHKEKETGKSGGSVMWQFGYTKLHCPEFFFLCFCYVLPQVASL